MKCELKLIAEGKSNLNLSVYIYDDLVSVNIGGTLYKVEGATNINVGLNYLIGDFKENTLKGLTLNSILSVIIDSLNFNYCKDKLTCFCQAVNSSLGIKNAKI